MTLTPAEVSRLLARNQIRPSRSLGQNFVADPNTVRKMARLAAVGQGDHVIEVGPGLGSLTLALAETGASVTALEKDRWLLPVLRSVLADKAPGADVEVVHSDAMTADWDQVLRAADDWSLVANLPYNIATPLVAELLDRVPLVRRFTFMVQQEAADRLAAGPGDGAYGAVSVKVAYWAEATRLGTVPASVFVPRPRVASAIVGLLRRDEPAVPPEEAPHDWLFSLVRAGFAQRRKMLRRSLSVFSLPDAAFSSAGIDPRARAEELSVHEWGHLAAAALAGRS